MNIVLGFIALLFCSFIGYLYSAKYSHKKDFYQTFVGFNNCLLTEVSFSKKSIIKLLSEKRDNTDVFYKIISEHFENIDNFSSRKNESLEKSKFLLQDDKDVVYSYLDNIGVSDKASQLQYLQAMEKVLKEKLNNAINDEKKYKSLCIKLGFLIGLAFFILIL